MLRPPHSKRSRDCPALSNLAERLDCGAFTAAFRFLHAVGFQPFEALPAFPAPQRTWAFKELRRVVLAGKVVK